MKKLLLIIAVAISITTVSAQEQTVSGPDGQLQVTVSLLDGAPVYQVTYQNKVMLERSPLGLLTNEGDFSKGMKLVGVDRTMVQKDYRQERIKQSEVHYKANQLTVTLENEKQRRLNVVFRVSNNDIAFRYELPQWGERKAVVIQKEATGFDFPDYATTFLSSMMLPMTGFARTAPSYESGYTNDEPVGKGTFQQQGYVFPGLFRIGADGWVLVSETGVDSRYCASHLSDGAAGGLYTVAFPDMRQNNGFGSNGAQLGLPGVTPWRTLTVGNTLKPIVETTVPFDVVEPLYEPSQTYRYGRSTWSWIVWQDNSMNWNDQVAYIDLAAAMGYEYILIDALWDTNIGRTRMKELVDYARSKHVDVFLWYNSNGYSNDAPQGPHNCMASSIARKKEMQWLHEIGVKGLKVDFFGGDKQETMRQYEDILSDANNYGLMIIFHGCTLPRGWERMYPNYVGSEAVLASEMLVFSEGVRQQEAFNATLHPFIRNAVGSMEFGGVFLNKYLNRGNEHGQKRLTTDAFQLATGILFQNPIQNFALTPNNLTDAPSFAIDFMKQIPTTWDETLFIDGYPGRYVVIARRHADRWYVAGVNAQEEPLKLKLSLPMLTGKQVTLINDDKTRVSSAKTATIDKKGVLEVTIQPRGGFVGTSTLSLNAQELMQQTPTGLKATINAVNIEVQFLNPATVRIIKSPEGWKYEKKSLAVTETPEAVKIDYRIDKNTARMKTAAMEVVLDGKTGVVSFFNSKGSKLLAEQGAPMFTDFNDAGSKTFTVRQAFRLDKDEAIYGLGIFQNGKMSQRNVSKHLVQGNTEDVMPVMQSVKGYGVFWDNYSPTDFSDTPEETAFRSVVGDCIDYYFMTGGNADGVVTQIRRLTGEVPMLPLWAYGFFQSKERYKSQEETVGVVQKYRELGVPLDGIIQDWQYWGHNYLWNAMDFQNPLFNNPQKMVNDIHALNAHFMISIWSSFGPATKPYRELNKKGMLFNIGTWPQSGLPAWPPNRDYPSGVLVYDAYNPAARDIYWKYLNDGIFKYGVDAWWMDSTEPDHHDFKPEDFDTKTYLGSFRKVRNAYPLMTVGGVYNHQRAVTSDKRVFILTRSGFVGQQRYGADIWSGDTQSSWQTLRNQIPAGLNFTLTGNPRFNSDIGGFFVGAYNRGYNGMAPRNPMFQELTVRWTQFGAFCSMMRSHGADTPREIYQFGKKGEPVYDAIAKAIRLRYSLLPYIYSTSWEVTHRRASFMRALVMDFPSDRKVWNIGNEYMFGKSLLVAPVVEAQYTPETGSMAGKTADFTQPKSTKVYLPKGAVWYDFWSNEKLRGGQEIVRATTLDFIPLYVKAGSIVPIGPDVQYVTEKAWDNLEMRVYPGADGVFALYEDEFDNYNYEKGAYTEIPFAWDNGSRKLTIGARKGSYKGMLATRRFTIVLPDGSKQTVDYSGKEVTVKL